MENSENNSTTEDSGIEEHVNIYHLFTKNELRSDIWMVLNMFPALNVTEISKLVKQSKSTVSRHLSEMEKDGFIISLETDSKISGRIPSKYYSIHPNAFRGQRISSMALPKDRAKRLEYIKAEIRMYKYFAYEISKTMDYLNRVMDDLDSKSVDIDSADEIYNAYLSGTLEPNVAYTFYPEEQFKQLMEVIRDFDAKRYSCCEQSKEIDTKGKEYCFFMGTLPLKVYLERLAKKTKIDDS